MKNTKNFFNERSGKKESGIIEKLKHPIISIFNLFKTQPDPVVSQEETEIVDNNRQSQEIVKDGSIIKQKEHLADDSYAKLISGGKYTDRYHGVQIKEHDRRITQSELRKLTEDTKFHIQNEEKYIQKKIHQAKFLQQIKNENMVKNVADDFIKANSKEITKRFSTNINPEIILSERKPLEAIPKESYYKVEFKVTPSSLLDKERERKQINPSLLPSLKNQNGQNAEKNSIWEYRAKQCQLEVKEVRNKLSLETIEKEKALLENKKQKFEITEKDREISEKDREIQKLKEKMNKKDTFIMTSSYEFTFSQTQRTDLKPAFITNNNSTEEVRNNTSNIQSNVFSINQNNNLSKTKNNMSVSKNNLSSEALRTKSKQLQLVSTHGIQVSPQKNLAKLVPQKENQVEFHRVVVQQNVETEQSLTVEPLQKVNEAVRNQLNNPEPIQQNIILQPQAEIAQDYSTHSLVHTTNQLITEERVTTIQSEHEAVNPQAENNNLNVTYNEISNTPETNINNENKTQNNYFSNSQNSNMFSVISNSSNEASQNIPTNNLQNIATSSTIIGPTVQNTAKDLNNASNNPFLMASNTVKNNSSLFTLNTSTNQFNDNTSLSSNSRMSSPASNLTFGGNQNNNNAGASAFKPIPTLMANRNAGTLPPIQENISSEGAMSVERLDSSISNFNSNNVNTNSHFSNPVGYNSLGINNSFSQPMNNFSIPNNNFSNPILSFPNANTNLGFPSTQPAFPFSNTQTNSNSFTNLNNNPFPNNTRFGAPTVNNPYMTTNPNNNNFPSQFGNSTQGSQGNNNVVFSSNPFGPNAPSRNSNQPKTTSLFDDQAPTRKTAPYKRK